MEVRVDGKVLTKDVDYTVREGSTIVTLKPAFLRTLSAGSHTISIVSQNGTAETSFNISADIASAKVTLDTSLTYNGGTQTQTIASVTLNGQPLTEGKDYTLTTAGFSATADIAAAPSKLDFKADRTKPIKGQVVTFSVTPQLKGDNRSFLQRLLGIDAPKVEFWVGNTKLGEVKVEEGKTSTFAYDTDKGGLKLGKNTVTAKFTGSGNLQGCEETLVINLQTTSSSAPTGDTSNIGLWTAALAVSVLALVGLGVGTVCCRKKRK